MAHVEGRGKGGRRAVIATVAGAGYLSRHEQQPAHAPYPYHPSFALCLCEQRRISERPRAATAAGAADRSDCISLLSNDFRVFFEGHYEKQIEAGFADADRDDSMGAEISRVSSKPR